MFFTVNSINDSKAMISASVMSGASVTIFLLAPIIVGQVMEGQWQLTADRAGLLPSSYFFGYLIACISSVFWVRRFNWRAVGFIAYLVITLGLLGASQTSQFEWLVALFSLSGIGAGIAYALSTCMVAESSEPDRYFGLKIVSEQFIGASLMFLLPIWFANNFSSFLIALAISISLLSVSCFWLPKTGNNNTATINKHKRAIIWPMIIGLFALLLYFSGLSGLWAFIERIANHNNLSADDIGQALAIGIMGGGVGGFCAAIINDRLGRLLPILISALGILVVIWQLNQSFSYLQFTLSAFFLSGLWNFSLAYQLGFLSQSDKTGFYHPFLAIALAAGAMLGPIVAGQLISQTSNFSTGFNQVSIFAIACVFLTLFVFSFLIRKSTSTK